MKLKDIILPVVLFALCSCAKQELGDSGGITTDEVRINYSLPVATVVETRSDKVTDETAINSMHILVFKDNAGVADKFVEIKEATITTDGTSTAKLSSSDGAKRHVRILANAQAIIDAALAINPNLFDPATATWTTISGALLVGKIEADGSEKPTSALPSTPLPMSSEDVLLDKIELGITSIGTAAAPVALKSAYAKVILQSTDAKLVITGVALHNAPAVGGAMFTTLIPASATRVDYYKADRFVFGTTPNYLFPTSVDALVDASKIDLIIKGHFDGETDATYYRISLSKSTTPGDHQTREYFDIQANYHYAVTLTSVGVHGYPSIQEAIDNPYSNIIYDTDTDMGNNSGMASNGQYCMKITNTNYEVTTAGVGVVLSKLTTDAPTTTQRSVQIVSSVSDGDFLVKDVAIDTDGNITATTADIGGAAVVRVTVGNISQDITITNADKTVAMVDTDEEAYLTVVCVGDIACSFSTELSDKLGLTITQPTGVDALKKGKVTLKRKDVLHTGLKYIGKIAVTDAKAKVSYSVPVTMEMYTVNVGGTLKLSDDKTRSYWSGGVGWAPNNLTMKNISSYIGMMVSVDSEQQDGMYFKWMTEWGGYDLSGPFSDGSGRTSASVNFDSWASMPPGVTGAPDEFKYDPCYNAGEIPGISLGHGDRRKKHWRSPTESELNSMIVAGAQVFIKPGARSYMNGRLKLTGHTWLDYASGIQASYLGGIFIDGAKDDLARFYRPHDDSFHWVDKNHGDRIRCVKVNTRK